MKVSTKRDGVLRICIISNAVRIGGAERVLLETIEILNEHGAKCVVLLHGEGTLADEFSKRGIPYRITFPAWLAQPLQASLWKKCKGVARFAIATIFAMRQMVIHKCDLVYSNTVTVGHGALAAKLLNKPHIWHLHEFSGVFHFYFGEAFSCRTVGRLSDVAIVVSRTMAQSYAQFIAPGKVVAIYPSMHLRLQQEPESVPACGAVQEEDGIFRCVVVGGICPGKGQEDAVQAFALIQQKTKKVQLVLVGGNEDEQYRRRLDAIIQENQLESAVHFAGEVRDAQPFVSMANAVLVCSRSEGFGRATIEALLAGIPVIGTDVDATPELIREGFNGLLYKVADAAGLAEKILYLCHNPDRARLLGEQGREWAVSIFNKRRYASELIETVNKVTEPARQLAQ